MHRRGEEAGEGGGAAAMTPGLSFEREGAGGRSAQIIGEETKPALQL